jgi:hypothetical protein
MHTGISDAFPSGEPLDIRIIGQSYDFSALAAHVRHPGRESGSRLLSRSPGKSRRQHLRADCFSKFPLRECGTVPLKLWNTFPLWFRRYRLPAWDWR